jgi:hypothetical protein
MAILETAPDGAQILDLGAARAARAEARTAAGDPNPVIKLTAGFVEVTPEVDVLSAEDFAAGQIRSGLSKLLIDPADVDELVKGGLSAEDLEQIVTFITGKRLGE